MKTESIEIRVRPDEKAAFKGAANLAGIPLSAWIRGDSDLLRSAN